MVSNAHRRAGASVILFRFKPKFTWFAIGLVFGSGMALADPYVTTLDSVEVTGQRVAEPVADALLSTTVISREDIEQSQLVDLVSILRQVAGVEIAQSGGVGAQASIFMRGANSDQTLVMIDGVKINSVESGGAFLQHIMLSEVDHVEIVRGNVSALYGSQAVGGVVQIFTRSYAGGFGGGAAVTVGGDDTRDISAHLFGNTGPSDARTSAAITVSSSESAGYSAIDAGRAAFANPADNNYRNQSFSANLSQEIGPVKLSAHLFDSEAHLDYDDPTDYTFIDPTYTGRYVDNFENSSLQTLSLLAEWQIRPGLSASLQAGGELDRSDNNSTFAGSFDIGNAKSQTNDYTFNTRWDAAEHMSINGGLEYLDQSGESSAYGARFSRHVESVFLGALGSYGPNQFQVNLRNDNYSDFGSATSALLSYGYSLNSQFKVIGSLSTAFTAPTFDDLFYPFASNPDLKPEKSRTAELGLVWHATQSQARISVYRSTIHDLIAFDDVLFIPENIDEARLEGIELSGQTTWHEMELSGSLTFDHPIDVVTDQPLLRRATRSGNLNLSYDGSAYRPYLEVSASGLRFDSDINTFQRISLGGYTTVNAGVHYTINRRLNAGLSLDNLADRRYALVDGYNTPGRVLLLTLSGSFP